MFEQNSQTLHEQEKKIDNGKTGNTSRKSTKREEKVE